MVSVYHFANYTLHSHHTAFPHLQQITTRLHIMLIINDVDLSPMTETRICRRWLASWRGRWWDRCSLSAIFVWCRFNALTRDRTQVCTNVPILIDFFLPLSNPLSLAFALTRLFEGSPGHLDTTFYHTITSIILTVISFSPRCIPRPNGRQNRR